MILVWAGNGCPLLVHMTLRWQRSGRQCCLQPGLLTVYTTKDYFVGSGKTMQEDNLLHSILLLTSPQEVKHV